MSLSLGKKLIIGGTLMVVLPILILGFYSYHSASDGLTKQARQSASNIAQRVADMTQLALEGQKAIAEELAASNTVINTASLVTDQGENSQTAIQSLDEMLVRVQEKIGANYEGIFVTDMDGKAYADSIKGGYKGLDVSDRAYFKQALSGKTSLGEVVESKKTGRPLAIIATPIKNRGKMVGAMVLTLKTDYLIEKISGFKVGETGYAWMTNKEGFFISHPNPKVILKENINKMDGMEMVARKMLAGQAGVIGYSYKGVPKTCGYAPVPLTGWSLAFTQNDEEFMSAVYDIRNGVALLGVIALIAAVLIVVFFARSITRPIMRVADGLNEASNQVSEASAEVASSSQQLAEGASEQAASIEETSASLEEITSMTRQNADNAQEANTLTDHANQVVGEASGIMEELTTSMKEISNASDETSKIIKTIDEIAFQTNLLALNAAVEAARAGEAGAGFAVVADEVRNLAMRAAEAAKSTQELIENTVERVHAGGNLVSNADDAFKKVLESSSKVGELIGEIAAASKEQAQGVDQINLAVSEMDKVTQTVAANAEESAASSEEMNSQAESMHEFVAQLLKVVTGNAAKNGNGPKKIQAPKKAQNLIGMSGNKTKNNQAAQKQAEKMIPLDEEADFSDF